MVTTRRPRSTPVVIGHRGASGYRPEHTASSYRLAVRMGCQLVEPDVVVTGDGVLVVRHENEIGQTTDVASHPEFAERYASRVVDGRHVDGWFVEDFTLAELKTLRANERLPRVRPASAAFNGREEVLTLDEVLLLVAEEAERAGREVGVCVELKHSTHFARLGLTLEDRLLDTLADHGLDDAGRGVVIESFETGNLRELRRCTGVPLIQLIEGWGAPADLVAASRPTTYADLLTDSGLDDIRRYADGISVRKEQLLTPSGGPSLVDRAHDRGLSIWAYTVRAENQFLSPDLWRGVEPSAAGEIEKEVRRLLDAGVDGIFADQPDVVLEACRLWDRACGTRYSATPQPS